MKQKQIILVGGGGHCRSVIDVIEEAGNYSIVGITDKQEKIGEIVSGYKIFAEDERLPELIKKYKHCIVTVGQLKSAKLKTKLFQFVKESGAKLPVITSTRAYISKHAVIGEGTVVMHGAIVNAGAVIGENCIINTNTIVEHDAKIGDHTHISTGAVVNGHSTVGSRTLIGSGCVILQQVSIGDEIIVGANSTVIEDLSEPGVYVGSPVKKVHSQNKH